MNQKFMKNNATFGEEWPYFASAYAACFEEQAVPYEALAKYGGRDTITLPASHKASQDTVELLIGKVYRKKLWY